MEGKKAYQDYKIGDMDPSGEKITEIRGASGSYLIWATKTTKLAYQFDLTPGSREFFAKFAKQRSQIENLITGSIEQDFDVNRQLARALASGLSSHGEQALKTLDELESQIRNYLETKGRTYYLITSTVLMILTLLVWITALALPPLVYSSAYEGLFVQYGRAFALYQLQVKMLLLGGLGGWLLLLKSYRELDVKAEDGPWGNVILAAAKILTAMICGLVAYWLIEADLLLSFIKKSPAGYNVVAVLAGFSEWLIPSFLHRLGQKMSESDKGGEDKGQGAVKTDSTPPIPPLALANNPDPGAELSEENKST